MKKFDALWLLVFLSNSISASSDPTDSINNPPIISLNLHYGLIIPHSDELKSISNSNPWGLELEAAKVLRKAKSYNNCNCYAKVGLSFFYTNFQNPDVLGNAYSLAIFAEPYFSLNPKIYTTLKAGVGISYLDQVYDPETNPDNLFYSSHISFLLQVALKLNFSLSKKWSLNIAANYNHISNSGVSEPNKGINFPTLSLGTSYYPRPFKLTKQKGSNGLRSKKWRSYGWLSGHIRTIQQDSVTNEIKNWTVGMETGFWRTLTNINALTGGIEIYYDGTVSDFNEQRNSSYNSWSVGIAFGHVFAFGRFSLTQTMVWYALKGFPYSNASFYQRYAINYRIFKWLQFGASLKAHGHVAQQMDLRLGFIY